MADLSITESDVVPQSNAVFIRGTVGSTTIVAGRCVYVDPADNLVKPTDANSATAKSLMGVSVNKGWTGQPVDIQVGGDLAIGTGVEGAVYYAAEAAGAMGEWSDLLSGSEVMIVGIVKATNTLQLILNDTGVAKG